MLCFKVNHRFLLWRVTRTCVCIYDNANECSSQALYIVFSNPHFVVVGYYVKWYNQEKSEGIIMPKFMKTLAVLTLIAGFIGGIVLGSTHQVLVAPEYTFMESKLGFNWELMISMWVGSVLSFGILYSIGKVLELLEKIAAAEKPVVETAKQPVCAESKNLEKSNPEQKNASAPRHEYLGYTICKKCGEENKPFEIYCGKCGERL